MFLALREVRRAKARFGLLTAAIALLVFLILTQQAIQNGLLTAFVGAIRPRADERPGPGPLRRADLGARHEARRAGRRPHPRGDEAPRHGGDHRHHDDRITHHADRTAHITDGRIAA
jgi:hypothetical protein